ncbi:MAG: energy transducer TonB [Rikenellaceae bacterium]|nr:energy transducer TonB [Rikenellaceae bacterium]
MAESNQQPQKQERPKARRPRLKLPFDNRRQDIGSWSYDNRRGLLVTIIAYLLLAIMFISSKITVTSEAANQSIVIDLKTLAELQEQKEKLEQEVKQRQMYEDLSDVRNLTSNAEAEEREMDHNLRDDRSTDVDKLAADAQRAQDRMRANRERYEQGLREQEELGKRDKSSEQSTSSSDSKVKGRVTVSYSFRNPVRSAQYLDIPAYRCEDGGEVIILVTINRNGDVVATSVDRAKSAPDDCMQQTALEASRRSRFNIDASAPERQTGTISYIFIPQ